MGTRSRIGVMHGDKVKSVYCHWDGYPEHNGFILQNFYDSVKANKLVSMGNLSSLGAEIGEAHDFHDNTDADDYKDTRCTFYGRDRGETGVAAKKFKDYEDYVANHQYEEYEYILRNVNGTATWFVADHSDKYVTLAEAFASVKEEA